jgi:hypothetical protein
MSSSPVLDTYPFHAVNRPSAFCRLRRWLNLVLLLSLQVFPSVALLGATPEQSVGTGTLSEKYPGDRGIGTDSAVVLYEDFDEGSLAAVIGRYDSYSNGGGMALVIDRPAGSPSRYSMRLTAGGFLHPATDLYKSFGVGYDELFIRYYSKYIGLGPWHHTGVWMGGYNPPLSHPYPRAGLRPTGNDLYSIGLEPIINLPGTPLDLYTYWRGMHSWKAKPIGMQGEYYGNTLLHDPEFRLQSDRWECYEIHLKLNPDPADGAGAVLEVWENDILIRRFNDHGPFGYWVRDKFCPADKAGTECTTYRPPHPSLVLLDQQWRSAAALKINYLLAQNYNTATTDSSMLLDDIVVATQRVGCIAATAQSQTRKARTGSPYAF